MTLHHDNAIEIQCNENNENPDYYFRLVRENLKNLDKDFDYLTPQVVEDMFDRRPISNSWRCCLYDVIKQPLIGFAEEYTRPFFRFTERNNPDCFQPLLEALPLREQICTGLLKKDATLLYVQLS